jgi:tetratricopeptide (TPR) repeat protein
MIQIGEIFCRYRKKLLVVRAFSQGLPAFCSLVLFARVACGQASNSASPVVDLSNLAPPPAVSDTNSYVTNSFETAFDDTNAPEVAPPANTDGTTNFAASLAMASYYKKTMQPDKAEPLLIALLAGNVPDSIQKQALMLLGAVVRDENDLPRAQDIYSQYLNRWPDDMRVPEVYLRQGEIFRQMGLTDLALSKFYSVMASSLSLKNNQFAYYQTLVLQTQVEIAETHYLMGHYVDAADFYQRLLDKDDPTLNRPQIEFRLIRSLTIIGKNDEAVGHAEDFLSRYPDADETPEVRYYLAQALKAVGRDSEALQQVILCLQQQKAKNGNDPAVWLYWQQRLGNEIGNQLYHQGDYVQALEIYADLAQLDSTPAWQIPVYYQMGLTYEKLAQPEKATASYSKILACQSAVGTNATPGMQAVFDMAQWRINYLKWETNAVAVDLSLAADAAAQTALVNSNSNSTPQTTP